MKLLLTGAGGMVGRNLLAHPLFRDLHILAPRRAELDLFDGTAVRRYLQEHRPDVILHGAAKVGGIEANRKANGTFLAENALLALNVIQGARELGIPRLLNLASSCMYPRDHEDLLRVEDLLTGPLEPTNEGYALAKLLSLRLTQFATRESGLSYKTIIPSNLYGPWDKFDPLNAHLIPSVLRKAHEAKLQGGPLEIWGDGTARREFLYVDDLLRFIHLALHRWEELPEVLNVGYGSDFSVKDYYRMACKELGFEPEFRFDLDRPSGMKRKLMDSSQAFALGWTPEVPPAEGMARTYRHFLEHAR